MKNRQRWLAATVVALGILLAIGSVGIGLAAGGTGPGDALPLPDGYQTLAPGQRTWYAFQYAGDRSEALAQLSASPAGSAAFAIWSPTDVDRWARGNGDSPSGRGSANAVYGEDLVWAGSSAQGGTWYVVVEASGSVPTSFNLKVSGSGVTSGLPTRAAATGTPTPRATGTPTPSPAAAGARAAATPIPQQYTYRRLTPTPTRPAQNPAEALPLPDGPQTLGVGQHVWYAFQYAGDRSRMLMRLHADPSGSATFTVWSWDVLQRWWEGYFYTPTGRGTPNEIYNGDLIWYGGSIIRGKWYVIVEQSGKSPATYTLTVTGTGVDRTLPPTVVPTPTYSLPLPTPGTYR